MTYMQLMKLVNFSAKPLQLPSVKLTGLPLSYLNLAHANLRQCDFS